VTDTIKSILARDHQQLARDLLAKAEQWPVPQLGCAGIGMP
jgi:hypothetical protein